MSKSGEKDQNYIKKIKKAGSYLHSRVGSQGREDIEY